MSFSAEISRFQDKEIIRLEAGKYRAVIAPFLGSNIVEMYDLELGIDFFRHDSSRSVEEMKKSPEVYGFPSLLFANRLADGIMKCSDYTYHFPVNDSEGGNHLHGFLHKREHSIVTAEVDGNTAIAKTKFIYNETDPFWGFFPVSFCAEFTFMLAENGMHYSLTITNTSDRQMPVGLCNHVAFRGPFEDGGDPLDTRLYLPIGDKWPLDPMTNDPTLNEVSLDNHDRQYLTGDIIPVKQNIDNDVYNIETGEIDGKPFRGALISNIRTGNQIVYEVDDNFKFWVVWNDGGEKGYFCPEPMTWMINAPNLPIPTSESGYMELSPYKSITVTECISSRHI